MQLKKTTLIVLAIVLVAAIVSPVMAAKKDPANHLYLYEKDPTTWTIVSDGAWGKMTYQDSKFVFNGHGLDAGVEYALIYYPDPWPGDTAYLDTTILGTGISNGGGNVNIAGTFDFTAIPTEDDGNTGAKIWLVLAEDHDGDKMIAWNPVEYLFENNLI